MTLHAVACAVGIAAVLAETGPRTAAAQEYATYIGDNNDYQVARIRTDAAGNTYVAGTVSSGSLSEVFVTKLDSSGNITASTTLSGQGADIASDMAIDATGNIYVAGSTSSTHFPLRGALQTTPGPGFLAKLGPDGGQLLYGTYFPAPVTALAVDSAGNIYVTGSTFSSSFPVTAGLPSGGPGSPAPNYRDSGAFITKIAAAGDRIVYSAVLAGHAKNCGCCSSCFLSQRSTAGIAIAVDPAGNAYIAGNTDTYDLPTTSGAFLQAGTGAFVAKVNAAGTALAYLSYIGSTYYPASPNTNAANTAKAIAVDHDGYAYLTGSTFDPSFPATQDAFQTAYAGPAYPSGSYDPPNPIPPHDAFVLKLSPDGSAAVWGTYLGGLGEDTAQAIGLDASGAVWIAGTTASTDFPNAQGWSQGEDFLVSLNPSGAALRYAARFSAGTVSASIALDPNGVVHVAGLAGLVSAIAPNAEATTRIFGVANAALGVAGGQAAPGLITIYGPHLGPAVSAAPPPGATSLPTSLGGVTVTANGNAIPLLYVSESQIDAVWNSSGGTAALRVLNNGTTSPDFPIWPVPASPQIFQNASGAALAVNQDGTVNSTEHPAQAGSIVSIWINGVTSLYTWYDGTIVPTARSYFCCEVYQEYSGERLEILYSGDAPGLARGVVQINFRVPSDAPEITSVTVVSGGRESSAATIYVAMP